jgi:stage V sporulation protein B
VTVSCVASVLYLLGCFRKDYRQLPDSSEPALSQGKTARQLLSIAVPITIGAAGLQLLTVLETGIYMDNLLELLHSGRYNTKVVQALREQVLANYPGISLENLQNKIAANLKGIYNMTQTVYNLPVAFVAPITISIIPAITSHLTLKNDAGAKLTTESAARITGLICMPCAVGLMVLSSPIMALLGGYRGEQLQLASQLMTIMGACIIFNSIVLLTNATMQAHGHANLPVVNMFIGGILKLVAVFVLTANPHIAIMGTPIGSFLCYVSITALNLITMRKCIPHCPAILKNLLRSLLSAAIMGIASYGAYVGTAAVVGENGSAVLLCGGPILVGVAVYVVAAIKLKAITREDCLLLPKGDKLAKLLKL